MILRLYSLLWRIVLLPVWLWWAWRTRKQAGPDERGRWRERLAWGRYPASAQNGLLVHAASIGEGVAAVELLRALRAADPQVPLLVTCSSFTGAQRLRRDLGSQVHQAFLPFDTPGAMTRLLDRTRPRVIVLMETELWPNLLAAARNRAIPVVLANARLSARSARGYSRLWALSRPMLQGLTKVLAQTRPIAKRFQILGVPAERLAVIGNLKSDLKVPSDTRERAAHWRQQLGDRPVIVAGSTHPGEDEVLVQALPQLQLHHPRVLLILVPRHPQRFDAVARLVAQQGYEVLRHSRAEAPVAKHAHAPVWLADTLGEMLTWMALADVAFVGGSLVPHGGHSPMEAMALGCPVVSGRHVRNFADAYRALDRSGAVTWVDKCDASTVASVVGSLLANRSARARLAEGGRRAFEVSAGAAARSAEIIIGLLYGADGAVERHDDGQTACWTQSVGVAPIQTSQASTPHHSGAAQAKAADRAGVSSLGQDSSHPVLRHYRRTGMFARHLGDIHVGFRPDRSPAMREFALLQALRARNLPVPRPLCARVKRVSPFCYRNDLIVERIPGARSIWECLAKGQRLDAVRWRSIGATIRCLHDAGIDHCNLDPHHLLVDEAGRAWLASVDRCRERPGQGWKAGNLTRLLRSLRRLTVRHRGFAFDESEDWSQLLYGYRAGGDGLRARKLVVENDSSLSR